MNKLLTLIICILSLQIVKADVSINPPSALSLADTNLLAPVVNPAPVSIYQGVIYKRRLDSIQQEVQMDYNEYVQAYIDTYMSRRDEIGRMIGLSRYYFPIYEKAFREAGIPDEIKYLSIVESALNPNAMSRVGAAGPWQFMSETAKIYGLKMTDMVDDRRDPVLASQAAAAYLKDAYQQFGDWLLAIASYNCGKSNVLHAMERTGASDFWSIRQYLPAETRGYVPAFIAINYMMKYPDRHGIVAQSGDLAIATDTIMLNKYVPLSRISAALGMSFKDICVLNPAYRQLIVNGTAAEPRRVIIPKVKSEKLSALRGAIKDLNAPILPTGPMQYISLAPLPPRPQQAVQYLQQPVPTDANGIKVLPAYHTTQKGDTLGDIANRYGIKVTDLLQWNKELGGSTTVRLMPGLTVRLNRG